MQWWMTLQGMVGDEAAGGGARIWRLRRSSTGRRCAACRGWWMEWLEGTVLEREACMWQLQGELHVC